MNTDLQEACEVLANLMATVTAAIASGDWTVDGACDPDADIGRGFRFLMDHDEDLR